jgi:ferrochelatase
MLHSQPTIEQGMKRLLENGVTDVVAVVMSPQVSPVTIDYLRALGHARTQLTRPPDVHFPEAWYEFPPFLDALAETAREAIATAHNDGQSPSHVLFTAHSLPAGAATPFMYREQVEATARAVAERALPSDQKWSVTFQSVPPGAVGWLEPELLDQIDERAVPDGCLVVIPVQFCAEHLEVLYDIDVLARQRAAAHRCTLMRSSSLNTRPSFIRALASLVLATLNRESVALLEPIANTVARARM